MNPLFILVIILIFLIILIFFSQNHKNDSEKDRLKFIVRAQLPYNNEKQDTYFAHLDGKIVFVKGPFIDESLIKNSMFNRDLRKILDLNHIDSKVIYLYPDRKINDRGIKTMVDPTIKYPFMIFKDISGGNVKNYKTYLEEGKKVVDWYNNEHCKTLNSNHLSNDNIMIEYVKNLIFKKIIGCYDLADRNFLIVNNHKFYAVDEEDSGQDFMVYKNLQKYQKDVIVKNFIVKNIQMFEILIENWYNKLSNINNMDKNKINKILLNLKSIDLQNF